MKNLMPIKEIVIKEGAINDLTPIINKIGVNSKIMIVCDNNTYKVAAKEIIERLESNNFFVTKCVLERDSLLIPDEYSLGEVLINLDKDTEFLLAVGSGTINDLVRFVSFKVGKPYGIVATAPSMDGYASSVSPLIVKGFKRTYSAVYPEIIIGDIDIISQAPYEMITAGFGDVIGKYTSLADWYISSVITGETYSDDIAAMVKESINKCIDASTGILGRDKKSIKELMEALIISGIAMLKFGNSRPASGAEHHLSHYLEMREILSENEHHLHGTKVGITSIIISEIYHYIFSFTLDDIKKFMSKKLSLNRDEFEERIKNAYGAIANEVLSNLNYFYLDEIKRKQRQERILEKWEHMRNWVKINVPDAATIQNLLQTIGAPSKLNEIGVSEVLLYDMLNNAKEIRKNYTILRLAEDINFPVEKLFEKVKKFLSTV
ncbi:3-dehydroquinate synthase [Thermoanaerobacter italicus Ab9]|uniref:3-dehydroquinate synthase n=1 Tax=Thermoanaerobacter italicus (strain DSM 9252 / Ab9) TaxID=580331 RepID=D3T3Z4_THEIA|nr:sn-glycerol-1-phosphate dehydrogenase [Thermoanaerobacter italicus]ADD02946.1 3-dehydroquinate synthase [Thermoanaerobacter italicus Ab9]